MENINRLSKRYLLDRMFISTGINKKENDLTGIINLKNEVKIKIEEDLFKGNKIVNLIETISEKWWSKWNLKEGEGIARKGLNWIKIKKGINKQDIFEILRKMDEIYFEKSFPKVLDFMNEQEENLDRNRWLKFKRLQDKTKISIIDINIKYKLKEIMINNLQKLVTKEEVYIEREYRVFGKHFIEILDKREIYPFIYRTLFKKETFISLMKWTLKNEYFETLEEMGIFNFYFLQLTKDNYNKITKMSKMMKKKENYMKYVLMKWLFSNESYRRFFNKKYIDWTNEQYTIGFTKKQMLSILEVEVNKILEENDKKIYMLKKKRVFPIMGRE